jgi:hypothetical protein
MTREHLQAAVESCETAPTGGPPLDLVLGAALGWFEVRGELNEELWDLRDQPEQLCGKGGQWEHTCPPLTSSLDAKVPGENITSSIYFPPRGGQEEARWICRHTAPPEEAQLSFVGTAATEALARRAAGLRALLSRTA